MANNTEALISSVGEHLIAHFQNECQYVDCANRAYQAEFTKTFNGFSMGQTVNALLPTYVATSSGNTATINSFTERTVPISLNYLENAAWSMTMPELTYKIQPGDVYDRVVRGAAIKLANAVDTQVAQIVAANCYNTVGDPTAPLNSPSSFNIWRSQLRKRGLDNQIKAILNANDGTQLQNSMQNFFNQSANTATLIQGKLPMMLTGEQPYISNNTPIHTVGTYTGTPLVNTAGQTGSSLVTDGWTAGAVLNAGDVFYISSGTPVRTVNPVSLNAIDVDTNSLQRFVVTATATADGSGNMTIPISPAITTTGVYQNVTNSPSDNAAITVIGASASQWRQNFMFDYDAISLAIVPQQQFMPGSGVIGKVITDPKSGVSLRLSIGSDVINNQQIWRADVLFGALALGDRMVRYVSGG